MRAFLTYMCWFWSGTVAALAHHEAVWMGGSLVLAMAGWFVFPRPHGSASSGPVSGLGRPTKP